MSGPKLRNTLCQKGTLMKEKPNLSEKKYTKSTFQSLASKYSP